MFQLKCVCPNTCMSDRRAARRAASGSEPAAVGSMVENTANHMPGLPQESCLPSQHRTKYPFNTSCHLRPWPDEGSTGSVSLAAAPAMHGHDHQQSPPDSQSSSLSSFHHKKHEKQQVNCASTRLVRQKMRQRDDIAGVPLRLVPDALIEAIHPLRQAQAACLATACRVSGRLAGHSMAAMATLCPRCRWAALADSPL